MAHCQHHVDRQIEAEEEIGQTEKHAEENESNVGDAQVDDIGQDKVGVDGYDKEAEEDGEDPRYETVGKVAHDLLVAGESDGGDDGEGEHEGHETVEQVVHAGQLVDLLVEGDEEGRQDGDGSREQHPLPLRPLQRTYGVVITIMIIVTWSKVPKLSSLSESVMRINHQDKSSS